VDSLLPTLEIAVLKLPATEDMLAVARSPIKATIKAYST